jgi:OPT family oligopeptide transporter
MVRADDTSSSDKEFTNEDSEFNPNTIKEKNAALSASASAKPEVSDSDDENVGITLNDISEIVITEDVDLPSLTVRMWIFAFGFASVIAGVDAFFQVRFPSISIGSIVGQLLCFPLGQLWHRVMPTWSLFGIELNPGPFNVKEHACVTIFMNVVVSARLVNMIFAEQVKYFNLDIGIGRAILFNIACYLMSYGWAGITLPILVKPANLIWPSTLSTCALFKTLHSKENRPADGWTISRFSFFGLSFAGSFIWYWFPDLIMPFTSYIGAWISWCKPSSAALGQVFGVKTGLGLFPLTLDWAQISSIGNPLVTPFWAVACIFGSFVFWVWIVIPGLYYTNKWNTAHLPIMSNGIFNINGTTFQANKVINKDWTLNVNKLETYSPVVLPIAFVINIALSLASFSALWVSFFFRFKTDVIDKLRNRQTDIHNQLMSKYKYPHWGIYVASMVAGLALGIAFCEGWDRDTQITSYAFVVSMVIGGALFVPLSLIESRANLNVGLGSFFDIISAFWFEGEPMTLMYFFSFGYSTLQHAMHMAQSAKIGHYMKVPPYASMTVLFFSAVWASVVNPSVTGWVLYNIEDVCTPNAKNNMICRSVQTAFNSDLIWGLLGKHLFGAGGRYSFVLYFFILGAGCSLLGVAIQYWRPKSIFWKKVNPTLFLAGAAKIPSVTGYNYSTWFLTAFIFNFVIHMRKNEWWKKYNLVLATGLDCGLAIAAILIYFCVVYTGASDNFSWWGTTVQNKGCDSKGCPHLPASEIKLPPGTIF